MKIIFAGTPDFAAKHLDIILQSKHEILSVLTQPDRESGRGKKINLSPVKQTALDNDIHVYQPESLKIEGVFDKLSLDKLTAIFGTLRIVEESQISDGLHLDGDLLGTLGCACSALS